ncbi:hypothetical protein ACJQWK_10792 [Exserohilum turcicum]
MEGEYNDPASGYHFDLSNSSNSEEMISISDEEQSRQVMNDRRLTQAISYLREEGGDDSPARYMKRVARINADLVQRLPQQGEDFDHTLYRHLQAAVREELAAFERARKDSHSTVLERDGVSALEHEEEISEDQLSEQHSPPPTPALYRIDELPDNIRPKSLRTGQKVEEKIQHVRQFHYGGPSNEAENWHSNFPAVLPFPETFQLAHWESLKIDFDISEPGKKLKADGKVVETNISFDHPALGRYKKLSLYESGSRFKLPTPPKEIADAANRLCTEEELAKHVDSFNRGGEKEELNKDSMPRIFLEKFSVQKQNGPTDIRRAMNVSPTKPHKTIPRAQVNRKAVADHQLRVAMEEARSAEKKARAATEKARKAALDARVIAEQVNSGKSSPVARRINRERARSLERSPRRQSGISTAAQSPESTPMMAAMLPQQTLNHPRGSSMPATQKSQAVPTPAPAAAPKPTRRTPVKRKQSIGDRAYTPERKRNKLTVPSSLKKGVGSTQHTLDKTVRFESEDSTDTSDSAIVATAYKRKTPGKKPISKAAKRVPPKPAANAGVKIVDTTMVIKKETKATTAGKAVDKAQAKKVVEEYVDEDD